MEGFLPSLSSALSDGFCRSRGFSCALKHAHFPTQGAPIPSFSSGSRTHRHLNARPQDRTGQAEQYAFYFTRFHQQICWARPLLVFVYTFTMEKQNNQPLKRGRNAIQCPLLIRVMDQRPLSNAHIQQAATKDLVVRIQIHIFIIGWMWLQQQQQKIFFNVCGGLLSSVRQSGMWG